MADTITTLQKALESAKAEKKNTLNKIDEEIDNLVAKYEEQRESWNAKIDKIESEINNLKKAEADKELKRKERLKLENEKAYNDAVEAFKKAQKDYYDRKAEYSDTSNKKNPFIVHDNKTGIDYDFSDLEKVLDILFK